MNYLEEKRQGSLYGGWLTKYQHIERLGHKDCEGLLDGIVTIQNKMDGANLTIAHDEEKGTIIASRNNTVSVGGHPASGFNGAVEYVLDHPYLASLAREGFILRGEWAVRHSLTYRADVYKQFYCFDVQDRDGNYLAYDQYESWLTDHHVKVIPELARLENPTIDQLTPFVTGPDDWGADQKEGIVVKRYDFMNIYGRTTWAKLVSADFREKNKLEFGATRYDPVELKYASLLTKEDVLKVIYKIKDTKGETSVRDMAQVLGCVWSDLWDDKLWTFVKKEKVKNFDFSAAQKLVITKAREIALAYYNGLMEAGYDRQ